MKLNSPLPQPLPAECQKASKIFKSFVDSSNNGLDGVIPRAVLQHAKGFAIFTIFKAGFLFSARAGSGIVIARLDDGTWSAPSAIGTAGVGFGGQAGAEMTDFLVVLNSSSAIRSFMSAGSLTLGGNMSVAVGPLGRNGEAIGSLNTNGKMAAMYSYSKTKGLFGGVSIEGSVIVERQDANAIAYGSDVTAKMLLSGRINTPEWADPLIRVLDACTGLPGGREWIDDAQDSLSSDNSYAFGSVRSPSGLSPQSKKKKTSKMPFPPASWGKQKNSGSYFSSDFSDETQFGESAGLQSNTSAARRPSKSVDLTPRWDTQFESDFQDDSQTRHRPTLSMPQPSSHGSRNPYTRDKSTFDPMDDNFLDSSSYSNPFGTSKSRSPSKPFPVKNRKPSWDDDDFLANDPSPPPVLETKPELRKPLAPYEGVARAIAMYDFKAVEAGDLSFNKGDVIIITKKSDSTDDWWTGKLRGSQGIFPANFVEVV